MSSIYIIDKMRILCKKQYNYFVFTITSYSYRLYYIYTSGIFTGGDLGDISPSNLFFVLNSYSVIPQDRVYR